MKGKEVLILSVGVFLTILSWIMLDVYHIQKKIKEQIQFKPAQIPAYQLDNRIIELLKEKKP